MAKLNGNKLGLTVGLFAAIVHAVWSIVVALGFGQSFFDWILKMHFVSLSVSISSFNIVNALILVVMGFVCGYIFGWIIAGLWNWVNK